MARRVSLVVPRPVVVGQEVKTGEIVVIIDATKTQNILKAVRYGVVKPSGPRPTILVAADDVLAKFDQFPLAPVKLCNRPTRDYS